MFKLCPLVKKQMEIIYRNIRKKDRWFNETLDIVQDDHMFLAISASLK